MEKLGVKVCPYCNRLFTTTVNTKGHRIRPQLDHFRNKSKYPFLALSINNLVPACGVCNLLKLDKDRNDLIYPYDEDFETEDYVFKTNIPASHSVPALEGVPLKEDDFQILMARRNPDIPTQDKERLERVKHSIQELSISELYQSHRDYVVFLYRQRYILTKQLAQDLFNQFGNVNGKKLFDSVEDVEHVFTLMHTDYVNWGNRPLAKLTRDITAEIDELYVKDPPEVRSVFIVKKSKDNDSIVNDT